MQFTFFVYFLPRIFLVDAEILNHLSSTAHYCRRGSRSTDFTQNVIHAYLSLFTKKDRDRGVWEDENSVVQLLWSPVQFISDREVRTIRPLFSTIDPLFIISPVIPHSYTDNHLTSVGDCLFWRTFICFSSFSFDLTECNFL